MCAKYFSKYRLRAMITVQRCYLINAIYKCGFHQVRLKLDAFLETFGCLGIRLKFREKQKISNFLILGSLNFHEQYPYG